MPVAVAHRQGSLLDTKGALADNGISRPYRGRLVRQEAVARLMHGWVLVLALANLLLVANAIAWFVIAQG